MDASNKDLPSFECVYQTLKAVGRNCRSRRQVLWWFQTIGIDCEFRLSRIRISSRNDRLGRETVLLGRIRAQAGRCCGAAAFIKIYYSAGRLLLRNFTPGG
jgi:hypothetical protein